ncbi:MAG: aminoglycoside 6-adenylyltransferase [Clostridia bacterium]|nr:aminoglycoside 6-adenylyltransferase [Clostridia bacterium]
MDRYAEILNNLLELARKDENLQVIVSIGSSTRESLPADEYSDLDLILVTSDTEGWFSGNYPEKLGKVSISFLEPTLGGGKERRCIYGEDKDVDLIVLTPEQFFRAVQDGTVGLVMNRGYRVLYDTCGAEEILEKNICREITGPGIRQGEFDNLVNDFYFHVIWSEKKRLRGELWAAKMCVDAYLKRHLLRMIELYCARISGKDVWHDGRFLDCWADGFILERLRKCFAEYEETSVRKALRETYSLFGCLARAVAEREGFPYPEEAEKCASALVGCS